MAEPPTLTIHGDYGEGGGQILRLAGALALVTGRRLRIDRIRASRPNPGLREQHLQALRALASLCDGELSGADIGSTVVELSPSPRRRRRLRIRIGTAGSVPLLLQAVLLPCFLAPASVALAIEGGGTLVRWSPTISSTEHVLLPLLARMGCAARLEVRRHGFYPKGGAQVTAEIEPAGRLQALRLTAQEELREVRGIALAATTLRRAEVAERAAQAARKVIHERLGAPASISSSYVDTACPGAAVTLWATFPACRLGWDALGERGKPAEQVGEEAATGLAAQVLSGATVDAHASDQLLPYLALCREPSIIRVPELTSHAGTTIWLLEQFLPVRFRIEGQMISCHPEPSHPL